MGFFYVVCIAFKVQCSNTIEYDPKKKLFKDLLRIFFDIFFWMKNDQEGGIKTDHFLTLDFYYNRGRRAYHFQKMDQLQRVRQSIFISMLYTTHYTFFVWYKFYSLPPFFTHQHRCEVFKYFLWATFFFPFNFSEGN